MNRRAQVLMLPTKNDLYIISNDDIEEGDWYYWPVTRSVIKCKLFGDEKSPSKDCKKIIGTTNPELKDVPQLPQSFIDMYRKSGGISEIDVAYTYESRVDMNGSHTVSHPRVRVDSYNCITAIPILH